MRYYFESQVEKAEDGYKIAVPFNVWEVCKQRDVILGDIVLDNAHIDCELRPYEKGNYFIHIDADQTVPVELNVPHKILLHITQSLIRMDQNSPYDFDHPIRQIDGVDIIIQPEDGLCGQACVAMLAGKTIAEVIMVMDCREWQATMCRVISALNYYGIDHSQVINFTEGKPVVLPKCCILMEKMGRYCHYLVHFDGKYYDSNLGILEEYDTTKLLGYLEIKC